MNIAIFTDTFLPNVNGVVTSIIDSVKALASRGHKIIIFAPRVKLFYHANLGENVQVRFIQGVNAFFYDGFRLTFPSTPYFITKLIENKVDIIHFHTQFSLGSEAILASKILKKPLVGTFHTFISDPGYLKHIKLDNIKAIQDLTWNYSNMFYNRCNLVISPSKKTAQVLKSRKVRKPIKVIPNSIDISKINVLNEYEKENLYKKWGINNKTIVFVGRVSHEKNISKLIQAFKLVLKKVPDARLLIIGGGPQLRELEKDSSKNVLFKGMVENKSLKRLGVLSACAIFATMSETENQPMTIIEAMASGLPIVGVNKLGIPEMIEKNGFCVKPGDVESFSEKLIQILTDTKLRKKLSNNSFELSKKYSSQEVSKLLEKTYVNLVQQR